MKINNSQIEEWYHRAMAKHSNVMMPFMIMCAQEGFVDLLKENLDYFKSDLCCEMLLLMSKEGFNVSCYNISYKFEYKINSKVNLFAKQSLIKANRVLYQRLNLKKRLMKK